ncbi:MAG TPA: hypothetical protein VJR23_06280 [Candidatus Acidoferrales bacterium]|nr:hypothetical protein [Candidatus Acidoferrales bacterium]
MEERTALIISCSLEQSSVIHERAEFERRTVSGYVMRILMRTLDIEDRLVFVQQDTSRPLTAYQPVRDPGPRTKMLLRCSKIEAQRIREGARRRRTTISWFVLYTLSLAWSAGDRALVEFRSK